MSQLGNNALNDSENTGFLFLNQKNTHPDLIFWIGISLQLSPPLVLEALIWYDGIFICRPFQQQMKILIQ